MDFRYFLILIIFIISSCVSRDFSGYIPIDKNYLHKSEYHIEGSFVPSYSYSYFTKLQDVVKLSLSISGEQEIWITLTVVVEGDAIFQFKEATLSIFDVESKELAVKSIGEFKRWTTSDLGYVSTLMPTALLKGKNTHIGKDGSIDTTYLANIKIQKWDFSRCIILSLPDMTINGEKVDISPIKFIKISNNKTSASCLDA